jgi:pyruvate/2-oxoacid:ferredoxin oxidoreductase alpha subunit
MRDNTLNILIGGEAGQGLVTVGQLLAKSLVRSGYFIVVTQSYQSRIRGGHNTFAIRVGVDEVIAPKEPVDLLVALDGDTVTLHRKDLSSTESGVSPRLLPGISKHLVVDDSDEHTEDGHITEDLSVRKLMVEKRLRKGEGMRAEVISPDVQGEEKPHLLLVSWGSSKGAVQEAATRMKSNGEKVATLHFSQVWPLVPDKFMEHLEKAEEVVCIEGNAFGQLSRLIRRETGFQINKKVLRYDGLPLTPESILRDL